MLMNDVTTNNSRIINNDIYKNTKMYDTSNSFTISDIYVNKTTKNSIAKVSINPTTKIPGNFYIEKNGNAKMIYIKKVLYNNPVTVVWWSDGTITRNRCPENVTYNPDTGLLFCIAKRLLGNNNVAEIFNAWSLPEYKEADNAYIALKDVRKTLREEGKLD